jgi:prepilin-type N-terminal cleavage/methylation domain-containing protein
MTSRRRTLRRGFTLVEVMIAMALASVLMAAVLTTYNFLGRQLARLTSFQALENESRKALAYLSRDFRLAQSVKTGTSPTSHSLTLVLPDGEVSYEFDPDTRALQRRATFGISPNLTLLGTTSCQCTAFALQYFTTTDGTPADQSSPTTYIPYSIKQIQVAYTLESPSTWSEATRTRYDAVSARYVLQNRSLPDGT